MITVTGVRAGINPALRWKMSLPMEKSISSDSSEVDFCCVSILFFAFRLYSVNRHFISS